MYSCPALENDLKRDGQQLARGTQLREYCAMPRDHNYTMERAGEPCAEGLS